MHIYMNMLFHSSEWIFNPMRYIGVIYAYMQFTKINRFPFIFQLNKYDCMDIFFEHFAFSWKRMWIVEIHFSGNK